MERLTERIADGIFVKENHCENGLRTFYLCYEEKPNDKYTNCDEGYCAIEKLAAYEDAEEHGRYGKWIPVSERLPEKKEDVLVCFDNTDIDSDIAWYAPNGRGWRNSSTGIPLQISPVAWMPLPEQYRESEESE